jgi:hypothetical protein
MRRPSPAAPASRVITSAADEPREVSENHRPSAQEASLVEQMHFCMRWPYKYKEPQGRGLILCLTRISQEERRARREVVLDFGYAQDNP